ncbi:serine/threonine-protein phosphatase 6 regulatory ankyrin repeat subunit B-like [Pyrus ussuriensis x Pyrus communis]|uniref:Serine/threonine-protein phosphatase 6 regulatory ankyrin repeat subunit B-like n=1 Tax=Pyrus ussuriensis x Pyrus communis TaxID=2448454 RepID=A0A5N5HH77_9ROSA|nr:serine/threonine-protein phosphatase 6 regulatory ankyrin repeat subunit B-like [Pyrus ussuriensis x Pyrus communis]
MKVVLREAEKLNLNNAGFLAQKRLAHGLRLNHPKAAALIATQILEFVRNGDKSVVELMDIGRQLLGRYKCSSKGGTVGDIGGAFQRRCISAGMRGGSCGVDADATDRALLQSSKPFLHTNVYCNVLISAIVSQQISVARLLLQFRVGAGLAVAYSVTWCAVEHFEATSVILHMLWQHHSPNIPDFGRTLIHQAILCNNERAVEVLLNCSADVEVPIKTTNSETDCPVHMSASAIAESARWALGFQQAVVEVIHSGEIAQSSDASIFSRLMFVTQANNVEALKKLIEGSDVDLNEQDEKGCSAAMIAAAIKLLIDAGADINLQTWSDSNGTIRYKSQR